MSQHHPIDDLFNRKLGNYVSETPMHLWEKIDQKRNWKHKLLNQLQLHKQNLMLAFSVVLLLTISSWYFTKPETTTLGHFPIPLAVAQINVPEPSVVTTAATSGTSVSESNQEAIQKEKEVVKPNINQTAIEKGKKSTSESKEMQVEIADFSLAKIEAEAMSSTETESGLSLEDSQVAQASATHSSGLKMDHLEALNTLSLSLEEDRFLGLFKPDPKCAKFKHGQWFLYLDMLASPDIPIRSLKARNNLYYNYVQNREQTESVEFSYSAGFRLSAVSGFGLAIRTGLNFSQINEQFNYYNENEEQITIHTISDPITGEIIGSDTTIVSGVRHKVTHNKFQIVDLPIILGYERDYKKFVFTVNAGAHINLYFESDGDFLSPDLEPISFSSNDPDGLRAFRNHLGVGWYGSLGVQYKLSPRFNLMFEPYFKMYPKGFSRSQYIVEQQYLSMGFSLGIRQRI